MLTKQPTDTLAAFKKILKDGRRPWHLCSDHGNEFPGVFKKFLQDQGINHFYATSPDVKASVVERFNRTVKTRLWKHFTKNKTLNWIDAIDDIVAAYNNSQHRSIGMAPNQVGIATEREVRAKLYNTPLKAPVKFKFKVGDTVRITKEKGKLSKGYQPNFTQEVFRVKECLNRSPATYRLEDASGEPIDGIFYNSELVATKSANAKGNKGRTPAAGRRVYKRRTRQHE